MKTNPFNQSRIPDDSFELFRWIFFEPFLLKDFDEDLSPREIISWFLRTFAWIVLFGIFFYLMINVILAYCDIPYYMSIYFNNEIVYNLKALHKFSDKFIFLLSYSYKKFIMWSLFGSFICGIIWALIGSLSWSLIISLSIAIILGVTKAFFVDIVVASILWSFVLGIIMGLMIDIKSAIFIGVLGFVSAFFIEGMDTGVGLFLGFEIGFFLSFFGILFYPFHQIKSLFFKITLLDNPYINDSKIYIPIFGLISKLEDEAFKKPLVAERFKFFLLKYRPLQVDIAIELTNIIYAAQMYYNPLDDNHIKAPEIDSNDIKEVQWLSSLNSIKKEIENFKKQTNVSNQIISINKIIILYSDFMVETKKLNNKWQKYYIKSIKENIKSANEFLQDLKAKKENQLYYKSVVI